MQVNHQEPVVALALSPAADLCAVRTADGAIGIMDLQQESFHTVLRCHTSSIVGIVAHPTRCLLRAQYPCMPSTVSVCGLAQTVKNVSGF